MHPLFQKIQEQERERKKLAAATIVSCSSSSSSSIGVGDGLQGADRGAEAAAAAATCPSSRGYVDAWGPWQVVYSEVVSKSTYTHPKTLCTRLSRLSENHTHTLHTHTRF